jgi:hypothetical protein
MKLQHPVLAHRKVARGAVGPTRIPSPAQPETLHLAQPGSSEGSSDPASEAVLIQMLRILERSQQGHQLTPIERALLVGAKALFAQLSLACDELLGAPQSTSAVSQPTAPTATLTPPERKPRKRDKT